MKELLVFSLMAFTSFFTLVNPLGTIPVFTTLTTGISKNDIRATAKTATLVALITTLMFAILGQFIFRMFGISVHSFRVVGGVIFFMMGYDMLQARLTRTKMDDQTQKDYTRDIAITPLGIPMICGPGAIANSMILMEDAHSLILKITLIFIIVLIFIVTYVILISGSRIMDFLGESGNKVLMRIMGLIVMVIAVEFFFAGLKPLIRDILRIG